MVITALHIHIVDCMHGGYTMAGMRNPISLSAVLSPSNSFNETNAPEWIFDTSFPGTGESEGYSTSGGWVAAGRVVEPSNVTGRV